ncbi:MAG TPA: DUF1549 and DUF1553 domain-containing protein, partial [Verrucomicrobiae bacterium]|nr:DUF1549 and DUF1553 domain-containing protein [Verrucomicrobiae bacterium]
KRRPLAVLSEHKHSVNRIIISIIFTTTCVGLSETPDRHRAFQNVRQQAVPIVQNQIWAKTPVDRFILAGLESAGIAPGPSANREQLIRRVTFGLLGLPPTPEEIDAFAGDRSPDAFDRLVDRLLASPRYGERWARHWLDLARYAESDGFEHDAVRPHSWRYRDYVIQSFNADKPYERFLREQIAGDELWPDSPEALTATAFNLLGPDMVDSADQVQRRLNTLNDMTDVTASVFLGLTLGCARCHHHKFEPLTQRDYFALQAFFAPATFQSERAIPTAPERAAHDRAQALYDEASRTLRQQIEELEAPHRERLFQEKLATLSEDAQLAHNTPKSQRTLEQENTVQETAGMVKVSETELAKALSGADRTRRQSLQNELKTIPKPPALPATMALANTNGVSPRTFILHRGDYQQPGDEVEPGFPAILEGNRPKAAQAPTSQVPNSDFQPEASLRRSAATSRRTALAAWLVSPANPLTARVLVNRIWQHHFGRGLVATPSDFGMRGARPTHPELLDWLAGEFVSQGWSIKAMHRLILRSAAYQQSSDALSEALERDPENKLFSRQNRVRLEGEAIRDSLLAVSGRLNPTMFGPSVLPPLPADLATSAKNWTANSGAADRARRSIYVFARRNLRFPFFEAFDAPDNNVTCPERGRSVTAPQALTLLNSEEVLTAAGAAATRVMQEASSADERIRRAFQLALGRAPTASEREKSRLFLREHRGGNPPPTEPAQTEFTALCRALFNLNAFVFVE